MNDALTLGIKVPLFHAVRHRCRLSARNIDMANIASLDPLYEQSKSPTLRYRQQERKRQSTIVSSCHIMSVCRAKREHPENLNQQQHRLAWLGATAAGDGRGSQCPAALFHTKLSH